MSLRRQECILAVGPSPLVYVIILYSLTDATILGGIANRGRRRRSRIKLWSLPISGLVEDIFLRVGGQGAKFVPSSMFPGNRSPFRGHVRSLVPGPPRAPRRSMMMASTACLPA